MRKYLVWFAVALVGLIGLSALLYHYFEIYPKPRDYRYSAEARSNQFLALERWLEAAKIPVHRERRYSLKELAAGDERVAIVAASALDWSGDSLGVVRPWIEGGGSLLVTLDGVPEDQGLLAFLSALGMKVSADPADPQDPGDPGDDEDDGADADSGTEMAVFDSNLIVEPAKNGTSLSDYSGRPRLARIVLGRGSVSVTGTPVFMHSIFLSTHANAALAWEFSGGAPLSRSGVIFVVGGKIESALFGRLAQRGHWLPLLLSLFALLLIALWMTLPSFGRVAPEFERPGKPLRERFGAEARFLQRYGALEVYRSSYLKSVRSRLQALGAITGEESPAEFFLVLSERTGIPTADLESLFTSKRKSSAAEFRRNLDEIERIMERI